MQESAKRFVVSLGGSLIVPDAIDVSFLKSFRDSLFALLKEGYAFILIPGGGATARRYQQVLAEHSSADASDRDRVGMRACALNAAFLHVFLKEKAYAEIVWNNAQIRGLSAPLIVAAGTLPGRSSDAGAVELAQATQTPCIVNLSNVSHVYARDPRANPEAEAYKEITWEEYRTLIPEAWDPGLSTPFDPVASRMAQEGNLTVAILNGHDIPSFEQFVRTGQCSGTLIRNGEA